MNDENFIKKLKMKHKNFRKYHIDLFLGVETNEDKIDLDHVLQLLRRILLVQFRDPLAQRRDVFFLLLHVPELARVIRGLVVEREADLPSQILPVFLKNKKKLAKNKSAAGFELAYVVGRIHLVALPGAEGLREELLHLDRGCLELEVGPSRSL